MPAFDTNELKTEIRTIMLNKVNDKPMESSNTPIKSISKTFNTSLKQRESTKKSSFPIDLVPRPHTLEDFVESEKLTNNCSIETSFTLNDCNDEEEFWIVDIPKTINPFHLKGQTLQLGNKSNFKIDGDRYCATNRESRSSLTCVLQIKNKSSRYKAVNIKSSGTLSIRKKLSGVSKNKITTEKSGSVPFPKNIKLRHPLLGSASE